jgi:hypothetical protein
MESKKQEPETFNEAIRDFQDAVRKLGDALIAPIRPLLDRYKWALYGDYGYVWCLLAWLPIAFAVWCVLFSVLITIVNLIMSTM